MAASVLLASCGGGGDDDEAGSRGTRPTVASVSVDRLSYGQPSTFTVTGANLAAGASYLFTGCASPATGAIATQDVQTFTCVPDRTLSVRLTTVHGGTEVHSTAFAVPKPQVTLTLGGPGLNAGAGATVVLELEPVVVPATVDNFLAYVRSGFYDGTLLHRVIPGFVNQGGGFTAGNAGLPVPKPNPGSPIALETNRGLSNTRGTVAMARTAAADSATSQFYVNIADNSRTLDWIDAARPGYAVFGRVVAGMDTMDAVNAGPTRSVGGFGDVPIDAVFVSQARQTR